MARPKRQLLSTASETTNPPDFLTPTQTIAQVLQASGNNLYTCKSASQKIVLVELPIRFRSTIWIRRGGYVLIDTKDADLRRNKIEGEIENVVREEKLWRKKTYWPKEFAPQAIYSQDDDDKEESVVGKMPPTSDDDDDEEVP